MAKALGYLLFLGAYLVAYRWLTARGRTFSLADEVLLRVKVNLVIFVVGVGLIFLYITVTDGW